MSRFWVIKKLKQKSDRAQQIPIPGKPSTCLIVKLFTLQGQLE